MQRKGANAIDAAMEDGRTVLSECEGMELLSAYGLPCVRSAVARTEDECLAALTRLRFPVAVKVRSPDIAHRTDVEGVMLGCRDAADVLEARRRVLDNAARNAPSAHLDGVALQEMVEGGVECLLGVVTDPQFGPMVAFGLGGVLVEVLGDVSLRVAPVDRSTARQMIAETLAARVLAGVRGQPPADLEAVVAALVAVGRLANEWGGVVREVDINPLIATREGARVVDALVVLEAGFGP